MQRTKSRTIVGIVLKDELDAMPPVIAVIDELISTGRTVKILCGSISNTLQKKLARDGVETQTYTEKRYQSRYLNSAYQWIKVRLAFKKAVKYDGFFNDTKLIWLGSGDTAIATLGIYHSKPTVLQVHELYDTLPIYTYFLKIISHKVNLVVCPDYFRSFILLSRWKLYTRPIVFLNRPVTRKEKDFASARQVSKTWLLENNVEVEKKILLYQGHITRERRLDIYARAISMLDDWIFVCMGKDHAGYMDELKACFPKIVHLSFIAPPNHLEITHNATAGLITYDPNSLNESFCAPNKIWEYSSCGVPFIGPDLPGLQIWSKQYKSGITIENINEYSIAIALRTISENRNMYSKACLELYNKFDQRATIDNILKKTILE
jgi:glycosyltransferase involved in cell wall biosynthesis